MYALLLRIFHRLSPEFLDRLVEPKLRAIFWDKRASQLSKLFYCPMLAQLGNNYGTNAT